MWYYSIDGQQQGPVDDAGLDNLIATGVVAADTYVWKDGMADWMQLAQGRPGGVPGVVAAGEAALNTCTICGQAVGADNLIELAGNRVCAACKPLAAQSLREGIAFPTKINSAWSDGKKVVAHDKTSLPARCYKCNHEVSEPPLKRKVYWHSPFWFLLIFFNLFVFVIVAMCVRKKATISIYLCPDHLRRRKKFIIGGCLGAVLGLGLIAAGINMNNVWLLLPGFTIFLAATLTALYSAQVARASKIEGDRAWLRGSGKDFIASLPPLP